MLKLISLSLMILASASFADEGYEVFKNNCKKCHAELLTKEYTLKNLDKIKAPPMNEVANRLKEQVSIKEDEFEDVKRRVIIAFIKDYIQNPRAEDTMCRMGAVEKFGVMPAVKTLKEDERQAVAKWIYDRYEDVKF
ncbi:cytochrome c [Sulfurimonas sp. HSL-1716]|uniref:c-type cytochrome n=1 Tax=Hydrocurvibacter sulfurireducens TaxID=3131937 RepID=UPI0031F87AD8